MPALGEYPPTASETAQPPTGPSDVTESQGETSLDAETQQKFTERDRLWTQALELRSAGKLAEAVEPLIQVLAIERDVLGDEHLDVAATWEELAQVYRDLEKFDDAKGACRRVLVITTKLLGADHWRVTDASLALADVARWQALSSVQWTELATADRLHVQAFDHSKAGRYAEAIKLAQRALGIRRTILGEQHPDCALSLNSLAWLYQEIRDYARAEPLYEQALKIRKQALGEQHPYYALSLNNLAWLYQARGYYARAEPLYKQALVIRKQALGEQHPYYAHSLHNLAWLYQEIGEYARAEPLYKQALQIRKQALGEEHPEYAASLNNLALLYQSMGDYARAEPLYKQALEIRKQAPGDQHPDYATSLNNLALLCQEMGDYARAEPLYKQALEIRKKALGELHPDYATSLSSLAWLYQARGDYARAELLSKQALEIRKNALGEAHPYYAASLNNLALLYKSMADYARAAPLYKQALEIRKQALGELHPDYATSLSNLASAYASMADYACAEPMYKQALKIRKQALGEKHPDYATGLNNLAWLYQEMGDYARAEPMYKQALEIRKKALGEAHPDYATSLSNLAAVYDLLGDYEGAEPLYKRALEIRKKAPGDQHPDYATSLHNLAWVYQARRDYARAEPMYKQALEIRKKSLGEAHPQYATSLHNLAWLYKDMGDYAGAEPLYKQALAIRKKALGELHPDYATSLNNLALLYQSMANYAGAEPLYKQALEIRKHALGEQHPYYALSLNNLAWLYQAMRDYPRAAPLYKQALEITRRNFDLASSVESERQQLAMAETLRYRLDNYVKLVRAEAKYADPVYREILAWKGAVTTRQQLMRALTAQPEIAPVAEKYQQVTSQLAMLSLGTPTSAQRNSWRTRIDTLQTEREQLEVDLSALSAEFRRARAPVGLEQLQAALPENAALVDFFEFGWDDDRQLVAFLVRRGQPIGFQVLNEADEIANLVAIWRGEQDRDFGQSDAAQQAATQLRRIIWEPLQEQLVNASMVLTSPDGALARFPLAALPGREPGKYLIEEINLAVIPVPQLLPHLLAPREPASLPGKMLALGNIDYDHHLAAPVEPVVAQSGFGARRDVRWEDREKFSRLEGTAGELARVRDLYEKKWGTAGLARYDGTAASEALFRQEASRHLYIHVATHGYFAPPSLVSALANTSHPAGLERIGEASHRGPVGWDPGLLSGLAFAGANLPPQPDGDDGILTAAEVGTLNLNHCELVVLSACETGLGQVAGGEGLLGLQRAFQVSGAKSVVASLWRVEDAATRDLMERFYANLWERDLGTLDALHEAQLWMLHEGASRGLKLAHGQPAQHKRLPPYYWAAFVLSGDWR
jgi:tetratricopeptide (TPR) repeat protein